MRSVQPHFLLFSGVESTGRPGGRWHFLLESLDGDTVVEASDEEAGLKGERLELLAVVRGLEALDQPSRVTLITASRDIRRGILYGLEEWRANHWCWERDGRWVPVKNRDLWQRIDRALRFHRLDCRRWRLDDRTSEVVERQSAPRELVAGVACVAQAPVVADSRPAATSVAAVADGWTSRVETPLRTQDAGDHRGGAHWWQTLSRMFRSQESDWNWASAN